MLLKICRMVVVMVVMVVDMVVMVVDLVVKRVVWPMAFHIDVDSDHSGESANQTASHEGGIVWWRDRDTSLPPSDHQAAQNSVAHVGLGFQARNANIQ